ncbi:alpha-1,3-mannosyl-glycoprotein 4-beta-N-acetylglucosaminyltransferase C-like [Patiria miniata]|uniref:MGAT4 conserved region domain-containing protein n=1 Tax=Patiria miniata TaxID=46514 RepID=A0A914AYH9_PATMI|nr:alpha-1,3-mannosyl-glycoprotein 4-beta-N-acetylglucosaminyltransferase C-like [Patiria miniata]
MHLTRSHYRILMSMVAALGMMGFLTVVAYVLDESLDATNQHADGKTRNAQTEVKIDNVQRPPVMKSSDLKERLSVTPKKPAPSVEIEMKSGDLKHIDREKALVLGHTRKDKGFLTIGIPASHAGGEDNLEQTLKSLIQNTEEAERPRVTIVVFAHDFDQSARQAVRYVVGNFTEPVQSGMLQLIEAPLSFYRTPEAQKNGQVKENLDNAFLISYSENLSEYYLQLDDSVKTVPGYVRSIRDFINGQGKKYWVTLEFSSKPFTGKLIRSGGRDQGQLTHLLVEFGEKLSVGKLYESFKKFNAQKQPIMHRPPLFDNLGNAP